MMENRVESTIWGLGPLPQSFCLLNKLRPLAASDPCLHRLLLPRQRRTCRGKGESMQMTSHHSRNGLVAQTIAAGT